jgi:3-deoxy-D-manno-octulosonic-acid transferase
MLAVILETEIWPNLYHRCGRLGIPLVMASARISPRSVQSYRRLVGLFRQALSNGIFIAAQSEQDAERFRSIGASSDRTHVVGNIKFDFSLPPSIESQVRNCAACWAWIAPCGWRAAPMRAKKTFSSPRTASCDRASHRRCWCWCRATRRAFGEVADSLRAQGVNS